MLKSEYVSHEMVEHVLWALTPVNRLVCEVALATGLRISDVLALERRILETDGPIVIKERKTGKERLLEIPWPLMLRMLQLARDNHSRYIFRHRDDPDRHRTRQAVWADLRRAAKAFRVRRHLSPHSLRKMYAVELYRRTGDLEAVQRALNHDDPAVTMIYALADHLQRKT